MVTGGAGRVGSYVLEFLARTPGIDKIVLTDINEALGRAVVNNAIIGTAVSDIYPKIEFKRLDLTSEDQIQTLIKEVEPRVIIHTGTLLSSFYYARIIKKRIKGLGIRSYLAGHTIAKDLALIYRLMKALKKTSIDAKVVNVTFPDNTHPVLAKRGLVPTVGAGTIDLNVQGIKKSVADKIGAPMNNIFVTMVAHHAVRVYPAGDVPYYLKIRCFGEDITGKFDLNELISESNRLTGIGVRDNAPMTAASIVKNVVAILNDSGLLTHAPGIDGIPGSVPVRLTSKGAEIMLPKDLSLEDVRKINEAGMRLDGIEKIEEDGTVFFTDQAIKLLREILHIDREKMRISETEEMAKELISAYKKLEKDLG